VSKYTNPETILEALEAHVTVMRAQAYEAMEAGAEDFQCGYVTATEELLRLFITIQALKDK
jgi:hypothetical protein